MVNAKVRMRPNNSTNGIVARHLLAPDLSSGIGLLFAYSRKYVHVCSSVNVKAD